MPSPESLPAYYQRHRLGWPATSQFTAYRIEDSEVAVPFPPARRDFYKLKLCWGAEGILSYATHQLPINQPALLLLNPLIPCNWQPTAGREQGFVCLFTEAFLTPQLKTIGVMDSPLFQLNSLPVVFPHLEAMARLQQLFTQIIDELQDNYVHKYEVLRNYVHLILHEALRLAPSDSAPSLGTAAERLSAKFLDLVDRQFPVLSLAEPPTLLNANEFARQLAVHPSHLTKVLKRTTGKTTREHLRDKLLAEAQGLLRYSEWPVADIAYCLGFGHAANFNAFFKRHTGEPPMQYRRQRLANA